MATTDWIDVIGLIFLPVLGIFLSGFYLLMRIQINAARQEAQSARSLAAEVASQLADFKTEVSKEYIGKADFRDAIRELKEVFHRELNEHNNKIEALFRKLDDVIQGNLFDRK